MSNRFIHRLAGHRRRLGPAGAAHSGRHHLRGARRAEAVRLPSAATAWKAPASSWPRSGLTPGYLMALLAGSAEFFGGLALLLGLLVRPAAAALAFAMLVAIFTVHIGKGLFMANNGYEFAPGAARGVGGAADRRCRPAVGWTPRWPRVQPRAERSSPHPRPARSLVIMNRLPSLFISHGAPTFAIEPGLAGPRLTALGRALPRPACRAGGVAALDDARARAWAWCRGRRRSTTSAGSTRRSTRSTTRSTAIPSWRSARWKCSAMPAGRPQPDERRGLDHGAWVPLRHLYPAADVPAFQVSLPARLDGDSAWAFGAALAPLADEGVLIVGSGSLTHNLDEFRSRPGGDEAYAAEFAAWVRDAVVQGDDARLRRTLSEAPHARRAHPTPEHFWPLLVAAGAAGAAARSTIEGGITHGVLSMDAFVFGALRTIR